jgi:hypothetical protein
MESHDEERVMFKNISAGNNSKPPYLVRDTLTSLKRAELNANFFFTIPGPKMIWQFGELGYDYSITYGGDRLAPKPIRWDYLSEWRRRYTMNVYSVLARLKTTEPVFSTTDFTTDLTGSVKRIWLRHASMNATILGNFDVITQNVVPDFSGTGKWYEFYTGDSLDVQNVSAPLTFKPGEYRIYTTKKLAKPLFTGVDDQLAWTTENQSKIHIFPNPASDILHAVFTSDHEMKQVEVSLFNSMGQLSGTLDQTLQSGVNQHITIDLKNLSRHQLSPGLYLLRISSGAKNLTGSFFIR